jgi:hypothetical protein
MYGASYVKVKLSVVKSCADVEVFIHKFSSSALQLSGKPHAPAAVNKAAEPSVFDAKEIQRAPDP